MLNTPENLTSGLQRIVWGLPHWLIPFGIDRTFVDAKELFLSEASAWAEDWLVALDGRLSAAEMNPQEHFDKLLLILPAAAAHAAGKLLARLDDRGESPNRAAAPLPPWIDVSFMEDVRAFAESNVTPLC